MQGAVIFFIKHFLISRLLYAWSTLINFGFLIKEDLWYVVLILDVTGLNVCIILISIRNFDNVITSIVRKIQNPIKFERLLRFRENFWKKVTYILYTITTNYLAQNLNFAELWVKMLFRKIQNFIKSERSDGFLPNSISNVLEHWSL